MIQSSLQQLLHFADFVVACVTVQVAVLQAEPVAAMMAALVHVLEDALEDVLVVGCPVAQETSCAHWEHQAL